MNCTSESSANEFDRERKARKKFRDVTEFEKRGREDAKRRELELLDVKYLQSFYAQSTNMNPNI